MPSAGRTSKPISGLDAPLMSATLVTFQLAGSIVTTVLPSTSPRIAPALAATGASSAAAKAPATTTDFKYLDMENLPERSPGLDVSPPGCRQLRGVLRRVAGRVATKRAISITGR